MSEPTRIALRLLGFVLLALGLGLVFILFVPGPRDVADWMGNSCAHERNGRAEQCSILDVLEVISIAPILILVGAIMALALRPSGSGPATIDLSGRRG